MSAREPFVQDPPRLGNTYSADPALRETLARLLPASVRAELEPQWLEMGRQAAGPLLELARQAEAQPPRHAPFDAWGRRVDRIEVAPAWRALHREAARWGLTAIPYEGALGPHARLHQLALLLLYSPSSAVYSCPLAMTDGAARTLLEHDAALARRLVPRFTSRDPEELWTCGQWMTERAGGSDLGRTETVARPEGAGAFRLWGAKWFCSAATSEAALTLARVEGAGEGSAGLSLFLLEQRLPDGGLNGIRVQRLKDKLGTRALPTAELELEGALAVPVGGLGHGVRKATPLLNLTRLHNAISACGMMARLLQLLRDWAARRVVFGEPLERKPLHRETLAGLQVEYEAALALTVECARLLGLVESGASGRERACLRLLTPLAKLATARQAVRVASEALEGFGGAGYVEDTGLPAWLRDAQVLPIWEGTTNVLSLDVLRASLRDGALEAWSADVRPRLEALREGPLGGEAARLRERAEGLVSFFQAAHRQAEPLLEPEARALSLGLAWAAAGLVLAEQGAWALAHGHGERAAAAARRWVREHEPRLPDAAQARRRAAEAAALAEGAPGSGPERR